MKDYYKILEIPSSAKPEKIRDQYRLLVIACHPDKFTDPVAKARAEEKIKEINEAYEILRDPSKRARYDRKWRQGQRTPPPRPQTWPMSRPERAERTPRQQVTEYLHYSFYASHGDSVHVEINQATHVYLVNQIHYYYFQEGQEFEHSGGFMTRSPVQLEIPYPGVWHVLVGRQEYPGGFQARVQLQRYGTW
jgi:curved DNA-binding protein CbpA